MHKWDMPIEDIDMNVSFKNVADEVDGILNKKREKFTSVCTRLGKVKERKIL